MRTQDCVNILLSSQPNSSMICNKVPFSVHINSVFVVDMNQLESAKDFFVTIWVFGSEAEAIKSGFRLTKKGL